MAVKRFRGKTKLMTFNRRGSDDSNNVKDGSFVILNTSGRITPLNNDTDDRILGVARKAVALDTTATADTEVPVEVPVEKFVEWDVDLDSDGGGAATDVGRYCAIDTTTDSGAGDMIDINDTVVRHFLVTAISDTTIDKARVVIVKGADLPLDTV